jgi:hypothetical protein
MKRCQECDAEFQPRPGGGKPQKFCSSRCRRASSARAWRERNRPVLATQCAECGGPISQKGSGRPRRFCTDTCKARAMNRRSRRARLPLREARERVCAHCGKTFIAKRVDRMYCYDSWCGQLAYQARRSLGSPRRIFEHEVRCDECGQTFTARHPTARWCSKPCANRHWGRVRSRRRGPLSTKPYTDREIFERDGWKCHLCGKKVSKTASRTDPKGATIDHLVPISLGGSDEAANVATAHYRCNLDKRARAMNEQLRLH